MKSKTKTQSKLKLIVSQDNVPGSNRCIVTQQAQLKLVSEFDAEEAHEMVVARDRRDAPANVTVIDFSTKMSGFLTCCQMIEGCKRMIAAIQANSRMNLNERAEKVAVLYQSIEGFETAARKVLAEYQDEMDSAA